MTDEELMRGFEMRLKGCTWEEIAKELNHCHGQVYREFKSTILFGRAGQSKTQHANVRKWMIREKISSKMLAEKAGVTTSAVYTNLRHVKIGRRVAEAICEMSGMTMEQIQYIEPEEKDYESAEI